MKVRQGFVSNSSSTSFIVYIPDETFIKKDFIKMVIVRLQESIRSKYGLELMYPFIESQLSKLQEKRFKIDEWYTDNELSEFLKTVLWDSDIDEYDRTCIIDELSYKGRDVIRAMSRAFEDLDLTVLDVDSPPDSHNITNINTEVLQGILKREK